MLEITRMTNASTFVLVLLCAAIGYVLEPILFSKYEDKKDAPEQMPVKEVVAEPTPAEAPDTAVNFDLSKLKPEDFPEQVNLLREVTIEDKVKGFSMQLKAGSKLKPVRLEEGELVVLPAGLPVEHVVLVDDTDFKKLTLPRMLERLKREEEELVITPEPAPVKPDPTPVVPVPAPKEDIVLDADAVVALMKANVAAGKVSEFTAAQVKTWKAGEDLELDGETYQTGRVFFEAESILGTNQYEAIALIEDGEIVKWLWAKNKLEMR